MKKSALIGLALATALSGCGFGDDSRSSSVKDLEEVIQQYHTALDAFVRGRPEPMKALFSRADDVVLANPFGPAVHGWDKASAAR
jgi:hypothetical protein